MASTSNFTPPGKKRLPLALRLIPLMDGSNLSIKAIFFRFFSWPISVLYRLVVRVRNSRFDSGQVDCYQASIPVVSVGNLTTGGTGKTPLVRWLCRNIRDRWGQRVGLLSRGYQKGDSAVNDEALELEWSLPDVPHLQDADRSSMAKIAIEEFESECLVLDDAFQHRKMGRDLDILVIDATNPFGFGHCLPRGLLREPVSGIKRADAVVITRCDQVSTEKIEEIESQVRSFGNDGLVIAKAIHQPVGIVDSKERRRPLSDIAGKNVLGFCGIGNPLSFFSAVKSCGATFLETRTFPDHHLYQTEDVQSLAQWGEDWSENQQENGCQVFGILTTLKDLVKVAVPRLGTTPLWAVEIQLRFLEGEQQLLSKIEEVVVNDRPIETHSDEPGSIEN